MLPILFGSMVAVYQGDNRWVTVSTRGRLWSNLYSLYKTHRQILRLALYYITFTKDSDNTNPVVWTQCHDSIQLSVILLPVTFRLLSSPPCFPMFFLSFLLFLIYSFPISSFLRQSVTVITKRDSIDDNIFCITHRQIYRITLVYILGVWPH